METPPSREIIILPSTMTLEQAINGWLNEKEGKSESEKTKKAYEERLHEFRSLLQSVGHDLNSAPSLIAPLLQGWAAFSKQEGKHVTPATYNQRVAIISSFYHYAMKHEVLPHNPAERIQRRTITIKNGAHRLTVAEVKEGLGSIDRTRREGKRDYAILSLALATGRRVSEIAALNYGDIQRDGKTAVILWRRCKGNKQMTDKIQDKTTTALYDYLDSVYSSPVAKDAPVWVSFSNKNKGQRISTRTMQRTCEKIFGTSKFHTTRHTYAMAMLDNGASLAEIGKGLGHSNLKTTSDYLEAQQGYENKYGAVLETVFNI